MQERADDSALRLHGMQEREAREDRHAAHKHTIPKQDMMRALHGHCLHGTREPEAREDRCAQHKHTTPNKTQCEPFTGIACTARGKPESREDRDAQHKHTTPNNGMMRALHGHCLHGTRES